MSKESRKIIVLGATGNVGREMLKTIASFKSLSGLKVIACATEGSAGKEVSFGSKILKTTTIDDVKIQENDIVLSAIGGTNIAKLADDIISCGAILIDNSSHFRMQENIPLVIPEINGHQLDNIKKNGHNGIIANPNCSTIQTLMAVNELHKKYKIKRMVASTYQAASGAGKELMDSLFKETKKMFEGGPFEGKLTAKQYAFNCIPKIGTMLESGYTDEEIKMHNETRKIMEDNSINVTATCVRVPVFNCHAVSLNVEFHNPFTNLEEVETILYNAEGVMYMDDRDETSFMTQAECSQTDSVFISRLRIDNSTPNALNMWIVADNLRKGAALNAVQIADALIKKGM